MSVIDARDASVQMDALLDAVGRGESFEIARDGKKVAQIIPLRGASRGRATKRMPDLSAFRASLKVSGASLSDSLLELRENTRY
ncbi:MAG TPA: hypothetical protein VKX17_26500 [Planctomycetota bacterium]|nr:hypothetical protein [Planctomycetota bacterium]